MQSKSPPSLRIPISLPQASELYLADTRSPYHFRRIASVKTIKSTSIVSRESSSDSPEADLLSSELQALAQVQKQSLSKPSAFNILVVGDAGLGKTSFIECMLRLKFYSGLVQDVLKEQQLGPVRPPTRSIRHNRASRTEGNLEVRIDLIDTPGYGTCPCFEEWMRTILEFISQENMAFVQGKEAGRKPEDSRIHMCLYFLEGPRVKRSDLAAMHALQGWVNIVPILAKADAFTPYEIVQVKLEIIQQCFDAGISLFDCAHYMNSDLRLLTESPLGPCPPFAVISAVECLELVTGTVTYGRVYPWGTCDVSNPNHSDFNLLYHVLIGYLLQPAIDLTKLLVRHQAKNREKEEVKAQPEFSLLKIVTMIGFIAIGSLITYRLTR